VDERAVRDAVARAGDEGAREVLRLFREAGLPDGEPQLLIEAVLGWNLDRVERRFRARLQTAVLAYGLLPLERGVEELLQRYLRLAEFARDAARMGPNRQATERATVRLALSALARGTGYSHAERLEWEMEARLAESVPSGRAWETGEYCIRLDLVAGSPRLAVTRNGRPLRSVPAAVRDSETYVEARAALDQLRHQAHRFRALFQEYMTVGQPLDADDLAALRRLPTARALLHGLIVRTANGTVGLLDGELTAIETLDDTTWKVDGPLRIAHPLDLHHAADLATWQRAVASRGVVQPFRQAFREQYVLTPAEEEARTVSHRFSGRELDPRRGRKLFQARGWQIDPRTVAFKLFTRAGIKAVFELPDSDYHRMFTGPITFWKTHGEGETADASPWDLMPLCDVPAPLFSEAMRDADLVVSVAFLGEAPTSSPETLEYRATLIRVLLDRLKLPQARVDGHFALIRGTLATYRVHLGSGSVHIDPGGYVCIVPANAARPRQPLFLPFAEEEDSGVGVIVSKILLLARDDRIRDESILRQIRRGPAD
jgi:hypothetical protein